MDRRTSEGNGHHRKQDVAALNQTATNAGRNNLLAYAIGMQPGYQTPPHIELIASKLEAMARGDLKRLIIQTAPRHGKSNLVSELFPAWYLGRNPTKQVMATTYGQELSDGFGRKVRNQIMDERFQLMFPECILSPDSKAAARFNTTKGGVYHAMGVGGAATGRGADILIVDDALKNREEADSKLMRDKLWDWFASVAYTRLMPGGAVATIQTRWHEDDLVGRLMNGKDKYELVNLPAVAEENDALNRAPGTALWPERYDEKALEQIRFTIGEREFAALYQQRPAPLEGAMFKRQWLTKGAVPRAGARIAMGVDLALSLKQSADYTAIVVIARDELGKLYVLDAVRERCDFPTALQLIKDMAAKWKPAQIGIETVAFQAVVVQELLRTTTLPIRGITPDRDKVTRAQPLALRYEQGMVSHAIGLQSWFESELLSFPQSEHDDGVDALVYAYQTVMRLGYGDEQTAQPAQLPAFEVFDTELGM
jgi:predicted phage terminase large subunit-like protein